MPCCSAGEVRYSDTVNLNSWFLFPRNSDFFVCACAALMKDRGVNYETADPEKLHCCLLSRGSDVM